MKPSIKVPPVNQLRTAAREPVEVEFFRAVFNLERAVQEAQASGFQCQVVSFMEFKECHESTMRIKAELGRNTQSSYPSDRGSAVAAKQYCSMCDRSR